VVSFIQKFSAVPPSVGVKQRRVGENARQMALRCCIQRKPNIASFSCFDNCEKVNYRFRSAIWK